MDTDRGGLGAALKSGDEISVKGQVAVGHARSVECETRMAMAIEEDQAAGGMGTFREQMHSFTSSQLPGGNAAGFAGPSSHADRRFTQEVDGSFGHHDFHDGFAVAGTGDPAGFGIGVTATADQRGIADASRKFAASAAGGSRCKQISFPIDGHGSYGSLYVTAMMLGRVLNRKSTRLNSSHGYISYAVFCLKKKKYLNSSHSIPVMLPRPAEMIFTAPEFVFACANMSLTDVGTESGMATDSTVRMVTIRVT